MAKITNIKTRDGAVHPIALPFAVCSNTVGATIKTLTFSGGDMPTELVNGQQIMVQFTNGSQTESTFSVKITDSASVTYTVPVVLNSSDSSVVPHIGTGAVVCLTYNNNSFYVSNAAALTGFEVPQDVTLATITNKGTISNIDNVVYTVQDGSSTSYKNGKIDCIYNGANDRGQVAQIDLIDNNGNISKIQNESGAAISSIQNNAYIQQITNTTLGGHIDELTNDGMIGSAITSKGEIVGYDGGIENNDFIAILNNNGTMGNASFSSTGISNTGNISKINNSGAIVTEVNSGTITTETNSGVIQELQSSGTITSLSNSGIVSSATNIGTIENLYNTTGTIGVPDSIGDGIFNGASATIHYIENSGKIVTFKNTGTTGNSDDTTTGVQNTGNLVNITNTDNGTIYQLTNAADIKTITIGTAGTYTGPGLIDQITNWSGDAPYNVSDYTPTKGIDHFTNKGRIKTLETTGDIGFAGTVPAVPAGYTPTGTNYDPDTGIQNTTGIIHNIQNDYKGRHSHNAVIRHIANYGGNGVGGISLFENGGDLSYLVNVPPSDAKPDIPGGNIGEIINLSTISKISNYGSVVIDNYNNLTINPKSGAHALNIEGSLQNSFSLDYGDIKYTTTPVVSGIWYSDPWATLDAATAETIPVYSHSSQARITLMLHNISADSSDPGVNLLYSTTSATAPIRFTTVYLNERVGTTSRATTLPLSLKWPGNDGDDGSSLLVIQNPNIGYESISENRTASLMAGTVAFYTINFGPYQNRKQAVALRLYRPEDIDSKMWISQLNL